MAYPSDITTKQWQQIKHHFKGENRGKHFQKHTKRKLVNAVLYVEKTGCQWRQLPKDFPKWETVFSFYQRACKSGLWEKIMDEMVEKTRVNAKRNPSPTYGLIDSQSVKTTLASEQRGIDGGKKS